MGKSVIVICLLTIMVFVIGCTKTTILNSSEPPNVVNPEARLTLDFQGEKPKELSAGLWENKNFVNLQTEDGVIHLPSKPGRYVLSVNGEWSGNNHGSYAVAIKVIL